MPERIRALGRASIGIGVADVAFVTLSYGSGLTVNCELSWLAPSKLRRAVLVGSERMVVHSELRGFLDNTVLASPDPAVRAEWLGKAVAVRDRAFDSPRRKWGRY